MRHNGIGQMTLFTGSKGVSHFTEAEGTHAARLKPNLVCMTKSHRFTYHLWPCLLISALSDKRLLNEIIYLVTALETHHKALGTSGIHPALETNTPKGELHLQG